MAKSVGLIPSRFGYSSLPALEITYVNLLYLNFTSNFEQYYSIYVALPKVPMVSRS